MHSTMTGRSRTLTLIAVALAVTLLATWGGLTRFPPAGVAAVVEPVQTTLAGAEAELTDQQRVVILEEQLVRANAENAILRSRMEDYLSIRGEGNLPPAQVVVVRARIIARTVRQGRRYCELDVGAVDGVSVGMAACLGWSLVGAVVGIQEGRSLVQLISDSESRIPAALLEKDVRLAEGVLSGSGRRGLMLLDYIEERDGLRVMAGQRVVTAGTDGRFPPGLVLGTVTAATRSATADHWHVEVAPLREADSADSLLILQFERASPR
jgi:cell shape-determining protein MreC